METKELIKTLKIAAESVYNIALKFLLYEAIRQLENYYNDYN